MYQLQLGNVELPKYYTNYVETHVTSNGLGQSFSWNTTTFVLPHLSTGSANLYAAYPDEVYIVYKVLLVCMLAMMIYFLQRLRYLRHFDVVIQTIAVIRIGLHSPLPIRRYTLSVVQDIPLSTI